MQVRQVEDALASLLDLSCRSLLMIVENMLPPWNLTPVRFCSSFINEL
jgi:hypothetical protein